MKIHRNTLHMTRSRFITITAQSAVVLALPGYEFSQAHLAYAAVTYQPGMYYFSDWNPELDPRNTVNSQRLYFLYVVAIIDWFSRYVLAWQTSITLETTFCLEALEQAFQTV